jgi:signal peptidase I
VLRFALRALHLGALPVALAVGTMGWLVPDAASGVGGPLGTLGHLAQRGPVVSAAALFLGFGWLVRQVEVPWRSRTPSPVEETRGVAAWRTNLFVVGVVAAAALGVGIRARVARSYQVLSASMLPALEPGDLVVGNQAAYGLRLRQTMPRVPQRGDIIFFPSSAVPVDGAPEVIVKRVIGLPGDRISMRGVTPVINGVQVPSCDAGAYLYFVPGGEGVLTQGRVRVEFLGDRAYLVTHSVEAPPAPDVYTVLPDEVFVLGDNRSASLDSRGWNDGRGSGVPIFAIEGRVDWRVAGHHRSGEADWTRFLRSVDGTTLHMEGVDAKELSEGIARCLRERPGTALIPKAGG